MAANIVDKNTCSICLERFKNPKVIVCHHSFCQGCLEDYVKVKQFIDTFPCPKCRRQIAIPEGGIKSFPVSFYIDTEVILDSCNHHTEREANIYCTDCSKALCVPCVAIYKHTDHELLDLKDARTGKVIIEQNNYLHNKVIKYQDKLLSVEDGFKIKYVDLEAAKKTAKEKVEAKVEEICKSVRNYGEQLCTEITNISDKQKDKLDLVNKQIKELTSAVETSLKLSKEIPCDISMVQALNKLNLFKEIVQKQDTTVLPDIPEIILPIFTENNVNIITSAEQIGHITGTEYNFNVNFNLADLQPDQFIYSPEFKMTEDVSWCMCAQYNTVRPPTLGLFLELNRHGSNTVKSCNVTYSLTLYSSVDGKSITRRDEQREISSGGNGRGFDINWDEFKDPTNGFLDADNKLSVSVTVIVHSIKKKDDDEDDDDDDEDDDEDDNDDEDGSDNNE